jgi:CRP-like cAMP-binding protein
MNILARDRAAELECDHRRRVADADCAHCVIRHRMLFADLDVESNTTLLKSIKHLWFSPGEIIYRQGEPSDVIFSVRRGVIKLSVTSADGQLRIVRLIGPGAVIGIEALVEQVFQHEAQTLTAVDVCAIPLRTMHQLAKEQPALCKRLMQQLQQQLVQADEHLLKLSMGSIRDRVIALIRELDELGGKGSVEFQLPSNTDIAALVAARIETVSRVMADLKRDGRLARTEDGRWVPALDRDLE